jgi:hypothetical protein
MRAFEVEKVINDPEDGEGIACGAGIARQKCHETDPGYDRGLFSFVFVSDSMLRRVDTRFRSASVRSTAMTPVSAIPQ